MSNLAALKTELLKSSVLKEGHLIKLGKSKLKLPKLHYYVLKPCGVYCYGTQNHDIPRGYIPLEPIEDISLSLGTVVESRTRLHFIKIADKRKQHVLACSSMEIRDSWITAILTAVAQNLNYENVSELLRKRFDSSRSNQSDEFDGAFCDVQPFTSPFRTNNIAKRKSKAKRPSVGDFGLLQKPAWLTKGKKKELRSKSLSCEDIHSIYTVDEAEAPLMRKRSSHDLTRYGEAEYPKLRAHDAQTKPSRAKNCNLPLLPSFGGGQGVVDNSATERKKICTAKYGQRGSPMIFDTKL